MNCNVIRQTCWTKLISVCINCNARLPEVYIAWKKIYFTEHFVATHMYATRTYFIGGVANNCQKV